MNKKNLTAEILERLQFLKTRPGQVSATSLPNYEHLSYYINGYLDGIGHIIGRSLYMNFHNWTAQQRKIAVPCFWARYIQLTHKQASDFELINLLLDDIATYFERNPNWQEDEDIPLRIWFDGENE